MIHAYTEDNDIISSFEGHAECLIYEYAMLGMRIAKAIGDDSPEKFSEFLNLVSDLVKNQYEHQNKRIKVIT